jgi:hypothetical protein
MTAKEQISFTRAVSIKWPRVKRQIPVISALFAFCAAAVAAPSRAPAHEAHAPAQAQKSPTLDQILDNLTESELNPKGLAQSNLAIDQLAQKAGALMRKAAKQRTNELTGKDTYSPLGQVMGQVVLALTDANAYLDKLKELQNALIASGTPAAGPKVNTHQTCKDLNREFKAVSTDLKNLKLGIKTLPLPQRAIADMILWDMESRLNSAIDRIRQRTIKVGGALTLKSELTLEDH